MPNHWIILLCACFLDAAFGYPHWLYARIRHPVVWMGKGITVLDRNFNRRQFSENLRRALGVLAIVILPAMTLAIALIIHLIGNGLLEILVISTLLAQRSLYDHVHEVYAAIEQHDLVAARERVSRIVGRDITALDEAGVCRAAIESLAESFSDGVVAPIFWAACFGLPGIACYKALNTADSMIGHKDEHYRAFGWAAARADDIANLIPARLSGLLIVLAAHSCAAWRVMWRDAHKHASPNAGWPEAAMAGALGIRLGGPRNYDGVEHPAPFIGGGLCDATKEQLRMALRLYVSACAALWLMLALAWLGTSIV
ncbi:MAG: cobalamin biosynthesis protein CobD [Pseudomonadota bacterium]|nr:cobalamin biosynthesis protein CobD [Pseudomonadota bacterium]MDE3038781.1 cobalamin biosynthesis protein CobD [Pseudomonadota bacterium]